MGLQVSLSFFATWLAVSGRLLTLFPRIPRDNSDRVCRGIRQGSLDTESPSDEAEGKGVGKEVYRGGICGEVGRADGGAGGDGQEIDEDRICGTDGMLDIWR